MYMDAKVNIWGLLDIYTSSSRTVDALSKLDLPSGVEVEIKAW